MVRLVKYMIPFSVILLALDPLLARRKGVGVYWTVVLIYPGIYLLEFYQPYQM